MNGDYFATLTASAEVSPLRRSPPGRRDVVERLAQLSMAQPESAITQLTAMLDEYRMEVWPGRARLRVLAEMAPAADALETSVRTQLANVSHPLPTAKASLVGAMLGLLQRLGDAYALAGCEMCSANGKLPLLGRARVVAALNQAVRHDQAAFFLACQSGRAVPGGVWRHLHAVYGVAAQCGVQQRPWRDAIARQERCVRDSYIEMLLLGLSGPYSYQQREWDDVAAASAALALHAALRDDHEGIAVAVDGSDSGPGHVAADAGATPSCAWSLDLAAPLALLDEAIAATAGETVTLATRDGTQVSLPRVLATHLSGMWHGNIERGHRRLPGTHALATLPGLHALHSALADGQDFDTVVQRFAGNDIEIAAQGTAAAWMSGDIADAGSPLLEARVLDQSVAGYRLAWSGAHRLRVKVGEVVGLAPGFDAAEGSAPTLWLVGVVRWLRSAPDAGLTAGVGVLARDARAVVARVVGEDGEPGRPQRALLIHDDGGDALLVARLAQRDVSELELSCDADSARGWPALHAARCRIGRVDALSGACDRVSLDDVSIPSNDAS